MKYIVKALRTCGMSSYHCSALIVSVGEPANVLENEATPNIGIGSEVPWNN